MKYLTLLGNCYIDSNNTDSKKIASVVIILTARKGTEEGDTRLSLIPLYHYVYCELLLLLSDSKEEPQFFYI